MEEKIRNDAENNTENKKKLTSHLDELLRSARLKLILCQMKRCMRASETALFWTLKFLANQGKSL